MNYVKEIKNLISKQLDSSTYLKDTLISISAFIIVLIIVILFTHLLYDVLIDKYVIDDSFFLTGFKVKMMKYAYVGYGVACICFTSYLLLAQKVNQLNELKGGSLADPKDKDKFNLLKSTFKNAFASSALILSLFIIWLGVLFSGVNSLELMSYYHQISGKDFLNNDFIYLVGIMHSLLLLIFYVPVQIAFSSISIVEEQKALQEEETKDLPAFKKAFIGFFENFSSVLITASPLLTSLIQGFIDNFLKN